MSKLSFKNNVLKASLLGFTSLGLLLTAQSHNAYAQVDMAQKPVLVITNKTVTPSNPAPIYSSPVRAPEVTTEQIASDSYFQNGKTAVGAKIDAMAKDMYGVQSTVGRLAEQLRAIESNGRGMAASYYASVATINTQLQTGTTPGNPRLVQKLDTAQQNLDALTGNVASLNALGVEVADTASRGAYLLDTIRSTYSLSGAVEEDHVRLAQMEDEVNGALVGVDRLLNNVNDDISRMSAYMATERNNLRTLSLAVANGELYGNSLANYPFANAQPSSLAQPVSYTAPIAPAPVMMAPAPVMREPVMAPAPVAPASAPAYIPPAVQPQPMTRQPAGLRPPAARISTAPRISRAIPDTTMAPVRATRLATPIAPPTAPAPQAMNAQPLAKIKFDKPNVNYEAPIYAAVQNAMQRYPNKRYELIAVHPTAGNAAQVAIESTRSRRNAERVLRTLTQMGVPLEKIDLSYAPSDEATSSEVHLFLR